MIIRAKECKLDPSTTAKGRIGPYGGGSTAISGYMNCTAHDYILGDTLDPTVPHWYSIVECEDGVWCPVVDGKVVAKVRLPYPPPIREVGSEVTTS